MKQQSKVENRHLELTVLIYTVGPGFAETIYGRKRWFLTAPDVKIQEHFHPNKTTLQWYVAHTTTLFLDVRLVEMI